MVAVVRCFIAAVLAACAITPVSAQTRIHTAGEAGAYHRDLCPALTKELTTVGVGGNVACQASSGTRENLERVRTSPRDLAFGQLDVFMLESGQLSSNMALQIVREDDMRECIFAVTRNREINSFGELAAYAPNLRVHLPPAASGSAGTFNVLKYVDRNGLGRAGSVVNAASVEDAIRNALARDDGVAFFVQLPDPDNERFKLVKDLGGHFVPVIDRTIIGQQVSGRSVYFAQETRIRNSRTGFGGSRVNTACTPVVLFTGANERVRPESDRRAHGDIVSAVRSITTDALIPPQSPLRGFRDRTSELTAEARERWLAYSNRTRDRALPFIERMIERAAPRY